MALGVSTPKANIRLGLSHSELGGRTNTVIGGFGPHHTPSGLGFDHFIDQPICFSFESPAPQEGNPPPVGDVFVQECMSSVRKWDGGDVIGQECMISVRKLDGSSLEVPLDSDNVPAITEDSGCLDSSLGNKVQPDVGHDNNAMYAGQGSSGSGRELDGISWSGSQGRTQYVDQVDLDAGCLRDQFLPLDSYDLQGVRCSRPCGIGACVGSHYLAGVKTQLNPCSFFEECFCSVEGVDVNASYIFKGVLEGFQILDEDFEGSYSCSNYDSIMDSEFKCQMDETIVRELDMGKVSRVATRPTCVHALEAIRKSNGKLRPITDCKRPEGESINNHMHTTCKEFTFMKLDEVAEYLIPGSYMAVLDLEAAYRLVHIAPKDRTHQGFVWNLDGKDEYYQDNCLCFGLLCAPYIFSRLTDFILRCMGRRGYTGIFGYLDDFLVVAESQELCNQKLQTLIQLLRHLGFGISWPKVVSPTTSLTYLGIEVDSIEMEFRLPMKKIVKLRTLLDSFGGVTSATKKELLSLAGYLSHASTVVRGGRTFSRRLLNFIKYLPDSHRRVPLPSWLEPDLSWWRSLLQIFNGSAKVIKTESEVKDSVSTDSSLTGFGGVWQQDWFLGAWDPGGCDKPVPFEHWELPPSDYSAEMNINILELWPILVSTRRWGKLWSGKRVRIFTDNTQVLQMVNTGRSSSTPCMFWIRELF